MRRITPLAIRLRGSFLSDVLTLSFGTLGGRLISLAALPAITRMYGPDDFALLATFLALVGTLAVAACLRLDVAIPLAASESEAANLLALALTVLSLITGLVALPVLVMPVKIAAIVGAPALAPYLWLVPLSIAMTGSYSIFQFWATRMHHFGPIARTRVGQAVAGVLAMLGLGWAGIAPFGLLLGSILNIGAGGVSLAITALIRDGLLLKGVRLRDMSSALLRNHRYPLLSTPEALLNVAGVQVPVLIIAAHGGAEAGFLVLAMQVMTAPIALLGASISQVYLSRAPAEYREGSLAPFTFAIVLRLALVGVAPVILAGALAPLIFPLLFGVQWARAGEIAAWLTPWIALQFVASPVSMVMYLVGWQMYSLIMNCLSFAGRVTAILVAVHFHWPPTEWFLISSAIFNILFLASYLRAATSRSSDTK